MTTRILLIGCGNMGFAMLKGWLSSDMAVEAHVVEPVAELRNRAAELGASVSMDAHGVPDGFNPQAVIIAVKPQVIEAVLPDYRFLASRALEKGERTLFISVAAGISISAITNLLGEDAAVIRCMPNTPAAIGAGMMVCCANHAVTAKQCDLSVSLLQLSGKVAFISDESQMDAVTAVSGSGPAYLFHFIEALSLAGKKAGLPEEFAAELALQTVYGAARLAHESKDTPTTLRQQVTSPNGTTAAALEIFMGQSELVNLVADAVAAAAARSVALGKA
ncbi:pyrroline-5-carboxylate reductase [Brucella gallinifaecis]|uniref:Pyrroline-5-carboxylate reductase n=1 Tax=Brucella gallinifaecis TaxID=215590 RepID=A0A502BKS0_9HYPH|nr:pyrroline-5-carboxylate reductase [Brucella gallinifaecis]TPF74705.1 pyrroline-5-carboxylate reductase [Brucella gallinifaecis]